MHKHPMLGKLLLYQAALGLSLSSIGRGVVHFEEALQLAPMHCPAGKACAQRQPGPEATMSSHKPYEALSHCRISDR